MDFVVIAKDIGIPVACLISLGLGVWRILVWLGVNVVKPVADRHIRFIDELALAGASQAKAMQMMSDHTERVSAKHDVLMEKHDSLMNLTLQLLKKHDALMTLLTDMQGHITKMEIRADTVTVTPSKGTQQ